MAKLMYAKLNYQVKAALKNMDQTKTLMSPSCIGIQILD